MSVKSEYKDSELGRIPESWKVVKLEEVCTKIVGGGTPSKNEPDYWNNGTIPWVTPSEFTKSKSNYISVTESKISEEGLKNSSATLLAIGTVIMSSRATIGECKINTIEITTNQGFISFQCNDLLNNLFLLYLIKQNKPNILKISSGSTFLEVSRTSMKNFSIAIPSLEEQKKIADILSTVDKKIAFVEENINATEELKKGLMQKLLTEGIGHTEFKDSELGRIPESWEVKNFSDILDIKSGFGFKAAEYTEEGIPLVKIDNVSYEEVIWDNISYLPENYLEEYKDLVLKENDILLALNRPITQNKLKMAVLKEQDCPSILYQRVGKVVFKTEELEHLYTFYILYKYIFYFVLQHSVGSDQPFINITKLRKMPIPIAPLEEQKQIAEILSTVDNKLENLKEKKQSFEELKKGLMQKLLTGEVRV